jgi:anti-sigma B factor antagonist
MLTNRPLTEILDGKVTIVVFGNELKQLDELNVAEVGQKLLELAESLPHPILVLDMGATEFFGSSFIEALFRVWKKLNNKPAAHFGIACLQPYCREVLEITHLDKLWPLFDTREAASEEFNRA